MNITFIHAILCTYTLSLPLVSPSLARAAKIMSPADEVTPLDIVAELAALDGKRDHKKSIRLLDQVGQMGRANGTQAAPAIILYNTLNLA